MLLSESASHSDLTVVTYVTGKISLSTPRIYGGKMKI